MKIKAGWAGRRHKNFPKKCFGFWRWDWLPRYTRHEYATFSGETCREVMLSWLCVYVSVKRVRRDSQKNKK